MEQTRSPFPLRLWHWTAARVLYTATLYFLICYLVRAARDPFTLFLFAILFVLSRSPGKETGEAASKPRNGQACGQRAGEAGVRRLRVYPDFRRNISERSNESFPCRGGVALPPAPDMRRIIGLPLGLKDLQAIELKEWTLVSRWISRNGDSQKGRAFRISGIQAA